MDAMKPPNFLALMNGLPGKPEPFELLQRHNPVLGHRKLSDITTSPLLMGRKTLHIRTFRPINMEAR